MDKEIEKIASMMTTKCSIVENDDEFMLMALHTHFMPQQQYSRVYALLSLFSQDNEHTKLAVLLFFQNPYAIFARIMQHYYGFQRNVVIFPSIVQAYTQPYSFDGSIKLIICQIRNVLSVTIQKISSS